MTFKHTGMENRSFPLTLRDLSRMLLKSLATMSGHVVRGEATLESLAALKNEFLDQLVSNINKR